MTRKLAQTDFGEGSYITDLEMVILNRSIETNQMVSPHGTQIKGITVIPMEADNESAGLNR